MFFKSYKHCDFIYIVELGSAGYELLQNNMGLEAFNSLIKALVLLRFGLEVCGSYKSD